jgi:hypothetical protein
MTGSVDIDGLHRDLVLIADGSSTDNVLGECTSFLALPPVQAVAGDQSKVVQLRALRMLLRNIADRASNMNVKMAAKLLLTHPGSRTKTLRVREAAEVPGAKTSERSVRRNQGELLSAFLNALLEFLDDPTAVRIFEREARKSLRLSSETSPRSAPRAYYVHREEFERRFKKLVSDGAKLIALVGQPGMGKTWLADSLTSQYDPAGSSVAWITFEPDGSMSLGDLYVALKTCGLPIGGLETGDPRFHLHRLTRDDEHAPRFVVLDNVPDTAVLNSLLPLETRSVIMVTTRLKTRPPEHCHIIDINPMADYEARRLVRQLLPHLDGDDVERLVQALHGFPQVIVFACRLIARKRISAQEFCDGLTNDPGAILSRVPSGASANLVSVLADMIDLLEEHDEAALELLECIALVGTLNKFPQCLLRRYFSTGNASRKIGDATTAVTYATALESLLDFCLIEEVDYDYVTIHPLTRNILIKLLGSRFRRVAERTMASVVASAPERYKEEISHLEFRDGEYFFEQTLFYEAIHVARVITIAKSLIGDDPVEGAKLGEDIVTTNGVIQLVAATAFNALGAQAVTKIAETAPAATAQALLDELKSDELFQAGLGKRIINGLELSNPESTELLENLRSIKAARSFRFSGEGIAENSPALRVLMHMINRGQDIVRSEHRRA